jgi:hypothetical protein
MQQVVRYDNLLGVVDLIIFVSLYKYIDFLILLLRKALSPLFIQGCPTVIFSTSALRLQPRSSVFFSILNVYNM